MILLISCFSMTTQSVDPGLAITALIGLAATTTTDPATIATAAKWAVKGMGTGVFGLFTIGAPIGILGNIQKTLAKEGLSGTTAVDSAVWVGLGAGLTYGCGLATRSLYRSACKDFEHLKALTEK